MADRDVTLDIVARDKTATATRSAARNFEKLKKDVDKSVGSIQSDTTRKLTRAMPGLGLLLIKPLVVAIAAGAPAIAAAIVSASALGVGAAIIGLGAFALRENKKLQKQFERTTTNIQKDLAKAAKPLVGPFLSSLKRFRMLSKDLAPDFRAMFVAMKPIVPLMTKAFSGVIKNVVESLRTAMPGVTAAFRGLAAALPGVGKILGDLFKTLFANPAVIENTTRALVSMLTGPLKLIGPLLSGLNVVFGAQVNLVKVWGQAWAQIWPRVVGFFDSGTGAVNRLKAAWGPARQAILNVWNALKQFAAAKTDAEIKAKFVNLVAAIKTAWGPVRTFLGTVWAEAWAFVKRVWNNTVVPWWNNIAKPWLKREFGNAMDAAVELMKAKAKQKFNELKAEVLRWLKAAIIGAVKAALGPVAGAGGSLGNAFVGGIIRGLAAGIGAIRGMVSTIRGLLSSAQSAGAAVGRAVAGASRATSGASFAAASFAAGTSGTHRTGGATPINVNSAITVSLDGVPFYAFTVKAIRDSQRRQDWRTRVGRIT